MTTNDRLKQYSCLAAAGVLVVVGSLATGFLPETTLYQVLAGAIIVAGFALGLVCLGGVDLPE